MSAMRRVTRSRPCEGCKKTDWCLYGTDAYICMRVESQRRKEFTDGSVGWLHMTGSRPLPPLARKPEDKPTLNVAETLERWRGSVWSRGGLDTLATLLGVSAEALRALGCVHADQPAVWGFPMKAGDGSYTGIRLRHENGKKWAVVGSHPGLFIPECEPQPELLVVEGPTDAAAGFMMGAQIVGRPSCNGGGTQIIDFIKRRKIRRVTIVADVDLDRPRPNGSTWNPGLDGARGLSAMLPVANRIVTLPTKDLRDFVSRGGTLQMFNALANQLIWNKPQ